MILHKTFSAWILEPSTEPPDIKQRLQATLERLKPPISDPSIMMQLVKGLYALGKGTLTHNSLWYKGSFDVVPQSTLLSTHLYLLCISHACSPLEGSRQISRKLYPTCTFSVVAVSLEATAVSSVSTRTCSPCEAEE